MKCRTTKRHAAVLEGVVYGQDGQGRASSDGSMVRSESIQMHRCIHRQTYIYTYIHRYGHACKYKSKRTCICKHKYLRTTARTHRLHELSSHCTMRHTASASVAWILEISTLACGNDESIKQHKQWTEQGQECKPTCARCCRAVAEVSAPRVCAETMAPQPRVLGCSVPAATSMRAGNASQTN